MSYENVPCASPDTESQEEPAPSLYGVDNDLRFVKKPIECVPSRLAETANIEDQLIMNDEEIAQVNRMNNRRELESEVRDVRVLLDNRDGETRENILRHGMDGNTGYSTSSIQLTRTRWMNVNVGNANRPRRYGTDFSEKGHNSAEVPSYEFGERSTSVIKRAKDTPELEHDREVDCRDTNKMGLVDKEEYVNLRCNENIASEDTSGEGRSNVHSLDRSRAYYYYYNNRDDAKAEPTMATRDREDYESDSERDRGSCLQESKESQIHKAQDQRALPQVYYMQYPNVVAMTQAGNMVGPQGMAALPPHIIREHIIRGRYGDNRVAHPGQRAAEYASSRPEQQVPVASSPGDSAEHGSVYANIPRHAQAAAVNSGIQYVDRQGVVQQGFAVLPGIGPVQVVDGMYYSAIPMGADPSHYENFAAVPSFVPNMGNMQAENTAAHIQRSHPQPLASANELTTQHSQDKSLNVSKPYSSPHHQGTNSPTSSVDDRKSAASPAVQSDSSSPVPPSLDESQDKKLLAGKTNKGRPKPLCGSRPEIKCEQCGKIFGSSSALAKHKLTHSDERRYVCTICSKGFKRQDHLNGHMVTHRDKKPYECSHLDCDKSYCDMRSLRRHLENHHAANQGDSGNVSRTESPSLLATEKTSANTVSAVTVVPAVGHVESAVGRVVLKPGRGRPPKDRTLKRECADMPMDQLQVAEYDSSKSSGRSTPASTHEVVHVRDQATMVTSRERNSDSCSSTGSEDAGEVPSGKVTESKQNINSKEESNTCTAIDMLKLAAERVQEHRVKLSTVERFQQQPYMVYPEGMPYAPWYSASLFPGQDPRFGVYPYSHMFAPSVYQVSPGQSMIVDGQNIQRQQVPGRIFVEGEGHAEMAKQKSGGLMHANQLAQPSPSQEYPSSNDASAEAFYQQQVAKTASGTPTDATAIALATAKEMGQHLYARESYYGVHPSGTQWQQVQYDETPYHYTSTDNNISSMGNVKTAYSHVRSPESNSSTSSDADPDHVEKYQRGAHFAAGVHLEGFERKPREGHSSETNNFRHVPQDGSMHVDERKPHIDSQLKDKAVFRNPAEIVTPRRKQRPRPEPLKIPPSVSTSFNLSRPGSPHNRSRPCSPPYTPPPMLSPRSIFSHVNAAGNLTPRSGVPPQLPMTPSRLLLSNRSCRSSFDADEEQLPFPEPKINVGPQFQAEIPEIVVPKEEAKKDVHKATLCWYPVDERKRGRREELEAFLDMACSVAVVGGSSNKEYALHILHRTRGNIREAIKLMLSKKYATPPSDPMYSYRYEGSVKWLARERQTFRNSFRIKGKEFSNLKKEIGNSKTVGDCVEFYYLWKATHPEAVRGRTRYVDSDSDEDYEEDTGSETNSNPSLFECDFPQCIAKFVSRQALNGHIRVHGGSFMKPSEPRKRRNPAPTLDNDTVVVKRRKPTVPAPPPVPLVEGGPLPEFACKVCGRIFHKIKSRSAHMKTHVKRPDDDDKHNIHRQ